MPDTIFGGDRRRPVLEIGGVELPAGTMPDAGQNASRFNCDRELMEAVARALRETGQPALRNLDIEISGGVVILWGRVSSYYQKQLAQETVQRIEGVQGIANGLEVVCCR